MYDVVTQQQPSNCKTVVDDADDSRRTLACRDPAALTSPPPPSPWFPSMWMAAVGGSKCVNR